MNGKRYLKVKQWFLDKQRATESHYQLYINYYNEQDATGSRPADEEGYQIVLVEEQAQESEKAIKVRLATGDVVGSINGFNLWIPKSLVKEM